MSINEQNINEMLDERLKSIESKLDDLEERIKNLEEKKNGDEPKIMGFWTTKL